MKKKKLDEDSFLFTALKFHNKNVKLNEAQYKSLISHHALKQLCGDCGEAMDFSIIYFQQNSQRSIIKVDNKYYFLLRNKVKLWAALTLFGNYNNLECAFVVEKVTSNIDSHLLPADLKCLMKKQFCSSRHHPHTCHLCGKSFGQSVQLKSHVTNVHQSGKPYSCTKCGRKFKDLERKKIHARIHDKVRPFVCSFGGCGKSFAQASSLLAHQRNHGDMAITPNCHGSHICLWCGIQYVNPITCKSNTSSEPKSYTIKTLLSNGEGRCAIPPKQLTHDTLPRFESLPYFGLRAGLFIDLKSADLIDVTNLFQHSNMVHNMTSLTTNISSQLGSLYDRKSVIKYGKT